MLVAADDRIEVVGRARDGREAVEFATMLQPDVIVMDIDMPRMEQPGAKSVRLKAPMKPLKGADDSIARYSGVWKKQATCAEFHRAEKSPPASANALLLP